LKSSNTISKMTWIYISGAAFFVFFLLAIFMIFSASTISSFGITKSFYYILLIPVGLCSAAFLFGALHSYARYTGDTSIGKLELSGPVVIFCLVVAGGFYFAEPESSFLLTIRLQNPDRPNELINKGSILIDLDNQRIKREIGENGESLFAGISSRFTGKEIRIYPEIPGYKAIDNNPVKIPSDHVIYFSINEQVDTTLVRGTLVDPDGNPVENVLLDFESGLAAGKTDENGKFKIYVPSAPGASLLLMATLNGKTLYRNYVTIPESNSLTIKIDSR
jgi:hypothetical protein